MLTVVAVLLVGCGHPNLEEKPRSRAETTPRVPSTAPSVSVSAKTSVCKDKKGDASPMDLVTASIGTRDDDVFLSAGLAGPIPRKGRAWVGFYVMRDRDISGYRQIEMVWVDGHVARPESSRDLRLSTADVEVEGNKVTLTLPVSTIEHLGDRWFWGAFSGWNGLAGIDGQDACPGAAGDMKGQPF